MIDTETFIENLHKEINRRRVRKERILNTIYLIGVFIFDYIIDNGEWI
jgi:hypothetical protein